MSQHEQGEMPSPCLPHHLIRSQFSDSTYLPSLHLSTQAAQAALPMMSTTTTASLRAPVRRASLGCSTTGRVRVPAAPRRGRPLVVVAALSTGSVKITVQGKHLEVRPALPNGNLSLASCVDAPSRVVYIGVAIYHTGPQFTAPIHRPAAHEPYPSDGRTSTLTRLFTALSQITEPIKAYTNEKIGHALEPFEEAVGVREVRTRHPEPFVAMTALAHILSTACAYPGIHHTPLSSPTNQYIQPGTAKLTCTSIHLLSGAAKQGNQTPLVLTQQAHMGTRLT
jgi:hypothetical protein